MGSSAASEAFSLDDGLNSSGGMILYALTLCYFTVY